MKKIEKQIYNHLIIAAHSALPEVASVNSPDSLSLVQGYTSTRKIYMARARKPDGSYVGILSVNPSSRAIPNCTLTFNDHAAAKSFMSMNPGDYRWYIEVNHEQEVAAPQEESPASDSDMEAQHNK